MRKLTLTIAIFWWLGATYALGALASVMRLRFGDDGPIGLGYQRIMLPGLVALVLCWLLKRKCARFDAMMLVLIASFCYALALGSYFNGFTSYTVSHVFQAVFAISMYYFGRTARWDDPVAFKGLVRATAMAVTIAHIPVMVLFLYWSATAGIYLGMSASILILAATIFFLDRRWTWAIVASVMVLMTGKRGEIAGLLFAIAVILAMARRALGLRFELGRGALLAAISLFVLLALVLLMGGELVSGIVNKFAAIFTTDFSDLESPETRAAIGGRAIELLSYYETFVEPGIKRLVTGLGYGWNVPMTHPDAETDTLHFVHVSPLNTVAQYGLLLAAIYWASMARVFFRAYRSYSYIDDSAYLVGYVGAMVMVSFTAYVISVDPGFWMCLGALSMRSPEFRNEFDNISALVRTEVRFDQSAAAKPSKVESVT